MSHPSGTTVVTVDANGPDFEVVTGVLEYLDIPEWVRNAIPDTE